jgi:hypothetical protein
MAQRGLNGNRRYSLPFFEFCGFTLSLREPRQGLRAAAASS